MSQTSPDLERPPDRILGGEESGSDALADDRHGQPPRHLLGVEPTALRQRQVGEPEVGGVDAHHLAGAAAALARDDGVEDDLGAGGLDRGNDAGHRLRVGVGEAGGVLLHLAGRLLLGLPFLLLDQRRDHDVVGAEQPHLLQDLLLGALADGEHRDHRGHAEQDAERSEAGAELVVPHRLQRGAKPEGPVRR